MAKLAGRFLRVYLEDAGGVLQDVSAGIQSVEIPDEYLEVDTTGLSEGTENSIPGLPGMPVEITGLFSPASGSLYDVVRGIAGKAAGYSLRVQVGQNAAPVVGDPEFSGEFWCSKVSFGVGAKGANVMTASLRVYGETAPAWDVVNLVLDQFTDVNGTLLSAHTPDKAPVGSTWAFTHGTFDIQSNVCNCASLGSGIATAYINSNLANCSISATIKAKASNQGFVLRAIDGNNCIIAYFTTGACGLAKRQSGSASLIGSNIGISLTLNVEYAIEVVLSGSTISLYIDGVLKYSRTSTYNQTETMHGLYSELTTTYVDDFQVTP